MISPVKSDGRQKDMDGPFRGSRPIERRSVPSRAQPAVRHTDEPLPAPEAPRVHHTPASRAPEKKDNRLKRFMLPIGIIIIILLGAGGWLLWKNLPGGSIGINSNEYQAVFLSNGQVYFGKLQTYHGGFMKLTDIFYLQTQSNDTSTKDSSNPQNAASNSQSNVQLIKLGNEIHGPEDEMMIVKSDMLFFENLKSSSKVVKTIDQYKKQN